MTNPFYSHTDGVPASQTRGVSQLIRNEFDLVQAAFETLAAYFGGVTGAILVTGVNGGAVNAYTLTPTTALPSYRTNMLAIITPNATNTLASTVNISTLGIKSILTIDGSALSSGDLVINVPVLIIYDGTAFRIFTVTKRYIDSLVATETAARIASDALLAPLASPGLTGIPTAPTAALGTNTTQIATMAALLAQAFATALPNQPGGSLTYNVQSINGSIVYTLAAGAMPDFLLQNAGVI